MSRWTLRAACDADLAFLFSVYASTRQDELACTGWDAAQTLAFLRSQFELQHNQYHRQFPQASYDVVWLDDQPVGRLYVDRSAQAIHVLDIALLLPYRQRGGGSMLLQAILAEAAAQGLPVELFVERNNPAAAWYRKLGFVLIDDSHGLYHEMRWQSFGLAESELLRSQACATA